MLNYNKKFENVSTETPRNTHRLVICVGIQMGGGYVRVNYACPHPWNTADLSHRSEEKDTGTPRSTGRNCLLIWTGSKVQTACRQEASFCLRTIDSTTSRRDGRREKREKKRHRERQKEKRKKRPGAAHQMVDTTKLLFLCLDYHHVHGEAEKNTTPRECVTGLLRRCTQLLCRSALLVCRFFLSLSLSLCYA